MHPKMKGATSERVLDILEAAQRLIDPLLIRQHISLELLQAQAYFAESSYQQAIECALSALEKCGQTLSCLQRDSIEKLHHQFLNTAYRDKPLLAYLGMKLRT